MYSPAQRPHVAYAGTTKGEAMKADVSFLWLEITEIFSLPGVRLATSYYSDDHAQHAAITQRRSSYTRTKANIVEALHRSIPLRVGVIDIHSGQRVEQAVTELEADERATHAALNDHTGMHPWPMRPPMPTIV